MGGGGVTPEESIIVQQLLHGHELAQVVNHLRWDGHPLLLEGFGTTHAVAFTLPRTRLSNSSETCSIFGLNLGTLKARGKFGRWLLARN